MQFKTTGKETFDLNMKKQKMLRSIIINKLEIKKIEKIRNFLEKLSFNALLVRSRVAFVHENVFSIW